MELTDIITESLRLKQEELDYNLMLAVFNHGMIPNYNYDFEQYFNTPNINPNDWDTNDVVTIVAESGINWKRKEEKVVELLKTKTISETPIFKLVDRTYKSLEQGIFNRSVVEMDSDAVAFMLYDIETGKFYTNSEFRSGLNRASVSIPAGKINEDETPEQAMFREVKEETGYDLNKVDNLHVSQVAVVNSSEGFTNEKTTVFIVAGSFSDVEVEDKKFDKDEYMTGGFYFTPHSLFGHLNELEISAPFHIALLHFKLGEF